MGSTQSAPDLSSLPLAGELPPAKAQDTINEGGTTKKNRRGKDNSNLTGFAFVQHKCRRRRRAYDTCYAKWYGGSFVTGENVNNREESCDELFDNWRECVMRGMKKDRDARGLPPPAKDSMLSEVDDDEE